MSSSYHRPTESNSERYSAGAYIYGAPAAGNIYAPPAGVKSYGAPVGGDPATWKLFSDVDTDRSGSISISELQSALVNGTPPFLHPAL
jgi:hypothetical protein